MDHTDHTQRCVSYQISAILERATYMLITIDLRISIREKGVLAIFHPDAADLFNVCSDLKRVCWTLYKPEIRLEQHVSRVFGLLYTVKANVPANQYRALPIVPSSTMLPFPLFVP